jgi:hypothetical protein
MIFNREKTICKKQIKIAQFSLARNLQNVNINYALGYEHYVNRVTGPKSCVRKFSSIILSITHHDNDQSTVCTYVGTFMAIFCMLSSNVVQITLARVGMGRYGTVPELLEPTLQYGIYRKNLSHKSRGAMKSSYIFIGKVH